MSPWHCWVKWIYSWLFGCILCVLREEQSNGWHRAEVIRLEQDIFTALAGQSKLYVYKTDRFWSQIKSAGLVSDLFITIILIHWLFYCLSSGCSVHVLFQLSYYESKQRKMLGFYLSYRSAIYASRLYLNQYHKTHPERLAIHEDGGPHIRGKDLIEI